MRAVEIARSYLGTPYHHQARVRGVGIDCVGLLICVARELGTVPADFDITGYGRVPDGVSLLRYMSDGLQRVEQSDIQPGDCVCVSFAKHPQHVGIVGDYTHGGLSMIHATNKYGKVLEHRLLFTPAMRFCAAFRFPEVN